MKSNFEPIDFTCAVVLIIQKFVTNMTCAFVTSVRVIAYLMTGGGGVVGSIRDVAVVTIDGGVSVVVAGVDNCVAFISV